MVSARDDFSGKHAETTDRIIKVFYTVANELGFGFLEVVYRRAMVLALRQAGFKAEQEVPIVVSFRGQVVGTFYADIVVDGSIILELKATNEMNQDFILQLLHYLRATDKEVGLLLVFGKTAQLRRVSMDNDRKALAREGHL